MLLPGSGELVADAPAERSEFLLRTRRHFARDQQPALGSRQIGAAREIIDRLDPWNVIERRRYDQLAVARLVPSAGSA